ncbi:MAG: glycosyltransferase [Pseudonocardia sp.]
MRIAMVSEHASPLAVLGGPDSGGQNVHVAELSRALAAAGHEVDVWTRREAPDLPEAVPYAPGVTVRHIAAGPPRRIPKDRLVPHVPRMAAALQNAWATELPDIVHAHFWMSGLASVTAAGRLGIPVVQTFHALGAVKRRHQGRDDTSPPGRVAAERAVAGQTDRVIATCNDEAFELSRLGVASGKIAVVPCGVDLAMFSPGGPALERRADVPRLVSIGRLVRRKGVDELIHAMRRVPRAELLVAGGPDPDALDDDADVQRLRAVADSAGVRSRVRFLGAVPRDRVPALLRSADAAVCVPWYEPFGMVALEAMACATAVVAAPVGGMTDTVVDQVTGVHVLPRRPARLAVALRGLLSQSTMVQAFGIAGRDRATACFGWERIAGATAGIYEQVIDERRERLGVPLAFEAAR